MGISELIKSVGDENIMCQYLHECMTNITTSKKGVSKVTFSTNCFTATDVVMGHPKIGMIVWFDRKYLPKPLTTTKP